jgi:hypothetical protein
MKKNSGMPNVYYLERQKGLKIILKADKRKNLVETGQPANVEADHFHYIAYA